MPRSPHYCGNCLFSRTLIKFDHDNELLKSAYKLVDAPNWKATLLDPALYHPNTVSGGLDGVLSLHVDDIKLAANSEISKALIDILTKRFGALSVQENEFEDCGLMHVQHEDGTVEIHQNHYLDTVLAPNHDKLKLSRDHADKELQGQDSNKFRTLLGQITTRSGSDNSIPPRKCIKTTREASTASSVTS
eukprot:2913942-Amphidinium_carterae.2